MVNVEVTRQSVCAADDQLNPLAATFRAPGTEALRVFIARLLARDFLQFSSSHAVLTGFASGRPIIRIHSDPGSAPRPEFLVPPETAIESCLPDRLLEFEWAGSKHSLWPNLSQGSI